MQIPHQDIPDETLRRLIESFVLREGTDYGHGEHELESKVQRVREQLDQGKVIIVFDPETETVNILSKTELEQRY